MRKCVYRKQPELETLVATPGPKLPPLALRVAPRVPSLWKSDTGEGHGGDGRQSCVRSSLGRWKNCATNSVVMMTANLLISPASSACALGSKPNQPDRFST